MIELEYGLVFLTLAAVFGLFMAWGIGANDVANAMATSTGSGAITLRQAIVVSIANSVGKLAQNSALPRGSCCLAAAVS